MNGIVNRNFFAPFLRTSIGIHIERVPTLLSRNVSFPVDLHFDIPSQQGDGAGGCYVGWAFKPTKKQNSSCKTAHPTVYSYQQGMS